MWRLRLDTAGAKLALEVRDADTLVAHFFAFDTNALQLKELEIRPEQSWWLGVEDAHANMLLLHGYGDRKLGQHKGIRAYDTESNRLIWEKPDHTFYGISAEGIVAFETALPEAGFSVLHTREGKLLQEGVSQQKAADLVQQFAGERYASCTYPVMYLAGEAYFDDVAQFLSYKLSVQPVQALEYAETNNCIFISYYLQQSEGELLNYLAVFGIDGNLLLKECLGEGLTGFGSDTFTIFNQNLYFVQHKEILRVYKLLQ